MSDQVSICINIDIPADMFKDVFAGRPDVISDIKRYSRQFDKEAFINAYSVNITGCDCKKESFRVGDEVYYMWGNRIYKGRISAILNGDAFHVKYKGLNRVVFSDNISHTFDGLVNALKSDIDE